MKLIRAEFRNFRLLKELVLDFPTSEDRKLVVIRAENESGNTTILNALQWGLYGDPALPSGRSEYRLHPLDWDGSKGERVPISVEIDFEIKTTRNSRTHGIIESIHVYRLVRSTHDLVRNDQWIVGPTTVELFELTESGSNPIAHPDSWLRAELPDELREIFFTDGDRALSFIEADVSALTKQKRVRGAIESLLGLDVIEDARDRVKKTAAEVNKKVREIGPDTDLQAVVGELGALAVTASDLEGKILDASRQFAEFDERHAGIENKIEDALVKDNRDDLNRHKIRTREALGVCDSQVREAAKLHTTLFRDISLSCEMVRSQIDYSLRQLDGLRDQGRIPNSTIPVLQERLGAINCICGEPLQGDGEGAVRRRVHIKTLIDQSRQTDEQQGVVTDLYYASGSLGLVGERSGGDWRAKYRSLADRRDGLDKRRSELGTELRSIEAKIAQIGDSNIQELRETRRYYREQRDRFANLKTRQEVDLRNVERRQGELERERDRLLRRQQAGYRILNDLAVAQDIQNVLSSVYQRLTEEELDKVSGRMNDVFLEMIGVDPAQGAIIRTAEISKEFEILVYGSRGRRLNPDRDLNGASRRALTMAFILSLARVSEVEAPNVIDTPLGMMSGYVKKKVLTTAIRESAQLILFLTRAEISACEDVLDAAAAVVITLTNPAHYPLMLVHRPVVEGAAVVRCECDHRSVCEVCERRGL